MTSTRRRGALERALTWSTAGLATAKGVQFGVSALYFTTVIGLSPATVGAGLTVAGAAGTAAAFGAGYLADRLGAYRIVLCATLAQAAALAAYCTARSAVAFALIACVAMAGQGAQRTAQTTLLAREFTGADRVSVRARLRVVTNAFVGLGSAAAAGALAIGTAAAYTVAMLACAILVLSSAVPLRSLRHIATAGRPPRAAASAGRSPLRDPRYLAVAALTGVITMQFGVLTVGMPLWVTGHTAAPAATVALLLVLNTLVVILFQVRAARLAHDLPAAGRTVLRAGIFLVVACALYAAAGHGGPGFAVGVLVLAVLAHSAGEILAEAGGWELTFELADPLSAGAYQGVSQTGFAVGTALAPAVVTSTAIENGGRGWLLLGTVLLVAAVATRFVARIPRRVPVPVG